jgi:hypothetical protein
MVKFSAKLENLSHRERIKIFFIVTIFSKISYEEYFPFVVGKEHFRCSLSLWRVVRGSKLMHLDLIQGLFIT